MATATLLPPSSGPDEGRLVFHGVPWNRYEAMLQALEDRHVRVTYDAGSMEVCVPSQRHEQAAQLFGLFVPRLAEELGIPFEPLGMTTWKKAGAAKGLEPDQCYYIQNEQIVRQKAVLDLDTDPPPDLAIEVDITSSSLNRMAIYAALGVPEVWRYDGETLTIDQLLPDGRYQPRGESRAFAGLRPDDIERFIELGRTTDKIQWIRMLRDWVHNELLPRRNGIVPGA